MERLVFDFPDHHTPFVFTDPVEVVTATRPDQVRPAIQRVEDAAARGLHAAGYIAYEAAPAFEPAMAVRRGGTLPLLTFGLFTAPETLPLRDRQSPTSVAPASMIDDRCSMLDWRLEWTPDQYAAAFDAVHEAIADGRTYQVNLSTRMRAALDDADFDPWPLYERMRRSQGSGYHAFLDLGRHVLLSASPELFFRVRGRAIETRPMKGTRRRGRWPDEDRALEAELRSSEKDRAENLMIVDLLRNDLGRICETGSVEVTDLQRIERYRTVLQMTSSVRGTLRPHVGLLAQLDALFPCGSVTGAPKISTMAEIARLEASPREAYCGAIGWVQPGGDCTFSVAIRTAWLDRERRLLEYGTGGGVVWDSTATGEYEELQAKAVVVREPWPRFELLETLALRGGRFTRLDRHLTRMRDSADHFGFPFPDAAIRSTLDDVAGRNPHREALVRITLSDDGTVAANTRPFGAGESAAELAGNAGESAGIAAGPPGVVLTESPVRSADPFLFHKTTNRQVYDSRAAMAPPDAMDVLLRNERGEVTEFTRGNVVVELDGSLVTPARASGLLAGCLRQELLDEGTVEERVVTLSELERATRIWFINSARGWMEVRLD